MVHNEGDSGVVSGLEVVAYDWDYYCNNVETSGVEDMTAHDQLHHEL